MKFAILLLFSSFILAEENLQAIAKINEPNSDISQANLIQDSVQNSTDHPLGKSVIDSQENIKYSVQPIGLNTVDNDEEGNWILKKLWWQEGQNAYNDILKINDELLPLQMSFIVLKTDSEKHFAEQWQKINLDEQSFSQKLVQFKDKITAEKVKRQGDLSENERQELIKIEDSEKNLEGLKKDFEDLFNYQMKLDDGLKEVLTHLKTCRGYETESWNLLQKIAKTLDDQKAREYYLQIEAAYKNTINLANYLKNDYQAYMKKLVQSQNSTLENIKLKVDQLKKNGYTFEKELAEEINSDNQVAKKRSEEKFKLEREKTQQAKIEKAKAKRSFIDNVYFKLNSWFSKIF